MVSDIYNTDIAAYIENMDVIERVTQPYVVIRPQLHGIHGRLQ